MRFENIKGQLYIMDLRDEKTQEELKAWIVDTYRDDDTFSEARVQETIDGINEGFYDAFIDDNMVHIEVEYGLGCLDAFIGMVGI